jgi:hypothetical protein
VTVAYVIGFMVMLAVHHFVPDPPLRGSLPAATAPAPGR